MNRHLSWIAAYSIVCGAVPAVLAQEAPSTQAEPQAQEPARPSEPVNVAEAPARSIDGLQELDDDRTDIVHEGLSIDALEDLDVYSPSGERIGEVEEVLGDSGGTIRALVVEFEGRFLGMRDREHVVPIEQATVDSQRRRVTIQLTPEEIKRLPQWTR